MSDIDPIAYGVLTAKVEAMEKKIDTMEIDIKMLLGMAERSKGSLWALMGVASVAGGVIAWITGFLFHKT